MTASSANPAALPRRPYGRAGDQLSIVGFSGILLNGVAPERAARLVAETCERGVNYFDVAPSYGNAEEILGPALEPYRARVFLACKSTERTRAGVAAEFTRSLQRLRTDHFDLYQLHALTDVSKDVDATFASGGAMEFLLEARRAGRVRHLGFSAHTVEAALAALDRYQFDSVLFPINFVLCQVSGFGPQVIAKAAERGASRLALKAMAWRPWPADHPDRKSYPNCWYEPLREPRLGSLALRFTLGQPVTAALPPGDEALFRRAVETAASFTPLTVVELGELQALAAKTTPIFPAP